MADAPLRREGTTRERVEAARERTRRRLLGLDRSGPPPPETVRQMPLRPFTLPNAISFARIALVPVFLVLSFSTEDGRSTAAAIVFATIAASDYLDGLTARLTGQYSRLGTLLDPLTDRLLVVSGVVVCLVFALLPRWALVVLAAREVLMVVLTQASLRRGLDIEVNMLGRWAVWPTMAGLGLAILTETWVADGLLYLGLAMTLGATVQYLQVGWRHLRGRPSSSG